MKVTIEKVNPSNGIYPKILDYQFNFRKTGIFEGENLITVIDPIEPTWWNRPLIEEADALLKIDKDGMYSFNLPIAFKHALWKKDYNVLVNVWSIPVVIQLKFKNKISNLGREAFQKLFFEVIFNTLTDLGIPKNSIAFLNNDVLLNGKKIAGMEYYLDDTKYCCALILTLKFKPEQELFDRLTYGKAKPKRQITGILDEFDIKYTKQECLQLFKDNLEYYLKQILQENPLDE